MSQVSSTTTTRLDGARDAGRVVNMAAGFDWAEPERPRRDYTKLLLIAGLGILSWVATYVGMLELIEANMGELPLIHKVIIGFSVGMLMLMIVWLLDQLFAPIGFFTKSCYFAGYVFLTIISVGFGFGFYWKVLESRSEATRSAESAVGQVQGALHGAVTRLELLQGNLDNLTALSSSKADSERSTGNSCPNSKPGDGPRRKMRDEDAARFKFASDFVKGRVGTLKGEMGGLEADMAKIVKSDAATFDAKSGTRNDYMRQLGRKLDMTVTGYNAFRTDPQLKQIRTDLADRADKVTFTDSKGGTYTCPDTQLSMALKGVVRAIDELPALEKPKIAVVEGSEAVIEAFRRLTATFLGALSFKLPPSPEQMRELQKKAVEQVDNARAQRQLAQATEQTGLSKRDYIPLAIALFVDLCLLLVSMGRPVNRMQGLLPKMREAERGPVIQILSRFNQIHRDEQIRENFEIFRHVVFDFGGDYYVAVPLDAPKRMNPKEREALRTEAQMLANLFTGLEKERLFSRIVRPLMRTESIRKRLRRQGSKFAESDAFRIYKFKDGAWSELILQAVMGAARRVEDERRARGDDVHALRTGGPLPGLPGTESGADGRIDGKKPSDTHDVEPELPGKIGLAGGAGRAPLHGATAGPHTLADAFGPYARYVGTPAEERAMRSDPRFAGAPHHTGAEPPPLRPPSWRPAAEDRPGDYAAPAAVRPVMPEPGLGRHANSNTVPGQGAAEPRRSAAGEIRSVSRPPASEVRGAIDAPRDISPLVANVIPLPGVRPAGAPPPRPSEAVEAIAVAAPVVEPRRADKSQAVNIELKERSVTFSVPASETSLPSDVAAGLQRLSRAGGQVIDAALPPIIVGQAVLKDEMPANLPALEPPVFTPPATPSHSDMSDVPALVTRLSEVLAVAEQQDEPVAVEGHGASKQEEQVETGVVRAVVAS